MWGKQTYRVGYVPVYALLTANGFDSVGYLYHALSLNGDVQVLFDENRADEYNLFDIRYVVAPNDHPFPAFVKPIGSFGRHRLYQVDTTGCFDVVDSQANFVWATRRDRPVEPLYQQLKAGGVLVRYMNYAGWGDGLRISIGSDEQIDACLALLNSMV